MSGQFAMVLSPAPAVPGGQGRDEAGPADAGGLLAQAAAGPGFWEDLLGELRRAGLIAELLADGAIARAVAQACGANALAVAIPCHRVVRTGGGLAGYRWGVERKRELIAREARSSSETDD